MVYVRSPSQHNIVSTESSFLNGVVTTIVRNRTEISYYITISCHVSSPVKIEDLIHAIKHPGEKLAGMTLPEPPSPAGDFVNRLEAALEGTKAKGDKLDWLQFRRVASATAKTQDVADKDSVNQKDIIIKWHLAVWVR